MSDKDGLSPETSSEPSTDDDGGGDNDDNDNRENRAVSVRLPPALLDALDDKLDHYHSRSEFVRDSIRKRLRRDSE